MIKESLLHRYPDGPERRITVREFIERICCKHIELGLADNNFEGNICSESDSRYWQGLSEALIAHEFLDVGLNLQPSRDGPDILILHDDRKIWTEVICPEPTGIPEQWLQPKPNEVVTLPHEAILLRWTSAIKEKTEKLLGNVVTEKPGYLAKRVVAPDDAYVIAINGRLLRGGCFASITGISQHPFAVEATFAVGPYAIRIDRDTLRAVESRHTHRDTIRKPNGSPVPADTFFDPNFRHISAILAVDLDGTSVIGNAKPTAVIHNPNARNPIPAGLLPAEWDYVAVQQEEDEHLLERRPGRLHAE